MKRRQKASRRQPKRAAQQGQQRPKKGQSIIVTRVAFAQLLQTTPDRITKFVAEGMPGVVKVGSGRGHETEIDLAAALPWVIQKRLNATDAERQRLFHLQGNKIEQEMRSRAGELVEVQEIDRRWAGIVLSCRERLLAIPSTASQRGLLANDAAEDTLTEMVDEALAELARGEGDDLRA